MKKSVNTRREFLRKTSFAALGLSFIGQAGLQASVSPMDPLYPEGPFSLPELTYNYNALEPHIDTLTMQIHHGKHHMAYVNKLNEAVDKVPGLREKSLEELITNITQLPDNVRTQIRNNGGGHWNHSFFWKILSPPSAKSEMSDVLKNKIIAKWNSVDAFRQEFNSAGTGQFGSGWAWLIREKSGDLKIVSTPNQDNPLMDISADRGKPVLGVDVWEHAYYLKHQNKRADYLNEIWNVIDWNAVNKLYSEG